MKSTRHSQPPRGFFIMDITFALIMALALMMMMTAMVIKQHRAEERLAHTRAATRDLETAMLKLQAGESLPHDIHLERLQSTDIPQIKGWTWIRLSHEYTQQYPSNTSTISLVGLVASNNIREGSQP